MKIGLKHKSKGKALHEASSSGTVTHKLEFPDQDSISFKNSRKHSSLKNKAVDMQESKGKESLVSIEIIKKAEAERNKLLQELSNMKIKTERDAEKIKSLYKEIQKIWNEKDSYKSRSNSIMSNLLLEIENLRRQSSIQEITNEKARLGFFSFANSFGRNMDDWIEGVDVRKIKDRMVGVTRTNWSTRRRNSKPCARSSRLGRRALNRIWSTASLGMRSKCN
jgi:hypothetical protein